MEIKRIKPKKVVTTLAITKEAQDLVFDYGYASARTIGMFVSDLIVDHHAKRTRQLTQAEIAAELHRLADLLVEDRPVAPIASEPAPTPLGNVIGAPSGRVGTTVLSEELGKE